MFKRPFQDRCRFGATTVALLAFACSAEAHAAGWREGACGKFTVAVIPDTQNYLDYRHQKSAGFAIDALEQFYEQMRWIAENARSNGGDIVFATHVGDVWQHYSEWMDPVHEARGFRWMKNSGSSDVAEGPHEQTRTFEIPKAIEGFRIIADALPFSVVPGNHDYDALWTDPDRPAQPERTGRLKTGIRHLGGTTGFSSAFGSDSEFFNGKPWYVDAHDGGADSAQVFTPGGCRLLHIGLQYHAPDESLAWARRVIKRFSGMPTIVTTHDYLDIEGRRNSASNPDNSILDHRDNNPQMMWDELISQHDQVFLVLSGHVGGQGFSVDRNDDGHAVYQIMADYQGRWQSAKDAGQKSSSAGRVGDGWLRLLEFDLDGDKPKVQVRTWSTFYKKFSSELKHYARWYKAHDLRNAEMSDADYSRRDEFVVELGDFNERFGGQGASR